MPNIPWLPTLGQRQAIEGANSPSDSNVFATMADVGGGVTWGSITGTLSAQTDLQAALDAKLSLTQTQALVSWTESGAAELTAITYNGTYPMVIASATAKWPDGSAGTLTVTSTNTTWQAVDAYTITHADSGLTVTQAAVTRDAYGNVTVKPALTVA
jgi:hypothetical protein